MANRYMSCRNRNHLRPLTLINVKAGPPIEGRDATKMTASSTVRARPTGSGECIERLSRALLRASLISQQLRGGNHWTGGLPRYRKAFRFGAGSWGILWHGACPASHKRPCCCGAQASLH